MKIISLANLSMPTVCRLPEQINTERKMWTSYSGCIEL